MTNGVQAAFRMFFDDYCAQHFLNEGQRKAAWAIMLCKSGVLGYNASGCEHCGYVGIHNNSCRNRNCPSCQAVPKEIWLDNRTSEVIDASYFHAVFTVPFELNDLIYDNQHVLYPLMHHVVSQTLLQLSADKKYLGATPGIIQVLHTWGQELNYHPHVHCVVTGAGLTETNQFIKGRDGFFVPVKVLSRVFRGKFIYELRNLYSANGLSFSNKLSHLSETAGWEEFIDSLYEKEWIPFIKETFNNFGNAIEYLGRYTHRIAISNSRIISISDEGVSFSAKDYRDGATKTVTLPGVEFISRFLMHVLPSGFQKIRNCGFLNNRFKSRNLAIITAITGKILSKRKLADMSPADVILAIWGVNIRICPACNKEGLKPCGKSWHPRS